MRKGATRRAFGWTGALSWIRSACTLLAVPEAKPTLTWDLCPSANVWSTCRRLSACRCRRYRCPAGTTGRPPPPTVHADTKLLRSDKTEAASAQTLVEALQGQVLT